MSRSVLSRFFLFLLLAPAVALGADRWAQLKLGMTADETVAALGQPLMRNVGRGFERWIYDNQAEVLFFGDLVGWSTPGANPAGKHSHDIWQANQGKDDFRAVLLLLPPPRVKVVRKPAAVEVNQLEWRPALRFLR